MCGIVIVTIIIIRFSTGELPRLLCSAVRWDKGRVEGFPKRVIFSENRKFCQHGGRDAPSRAYPKASVPHLPIS